MAAPVGNQFWKLRSKHGRDKLFSNPEAMWEAACEYFNWCDAHPWFRNEPIKSGMEQGTCMKIHMARPYTIQGLCRYLHCNTAYFRTFKSQLTEKNKDFNTVIKDIEEAIYQQKFEGAAVGAFNANLIARDLGLADKTELTGKDGKDLMPPTQVIIENPHASPSRKKGK